MKTSLLSRDTVTKFINNTEDDVTVGERFVDDIENLFIQALLDARVIDRKHYGELFQIISSNAHAQITDRAEKANKHPVMDVDDRVGLRTVLDTDLRKVKGHFPYIDEHGDSVAEEERKVFQLMTEMNKIMNELVDSYECTSQALKMDNIDAFEDALQHFLIL